MTNNQVAAQIKAAGWGNKSQILTSHLGSLIQQGHWPSGSKVPATRQIAKDYGVSLETVRSAMRELQGRGLIRIKPRSGAVVCHPPTHPLPQGSADFSGSRAGFDLSATPSRPGRCGRSPRGLGDPGIVAYVRLLDWATTSGDPHVPGDEILVGLEQRLIEKKIPLALVSERPTLENRGRLLADRLEQLHNQLAGVVLVRPPADVRLAVTRRLDELQLPWISIGQSSRQEVGNIVPDYFRMGQLMGQYLAAIQARHILFVTLAFKPGERFSGMAKMQGVVGGYLQLNQPSPVITPLLCDNTLPQSGYHAMAAFLRDNPPPDAIIGHGDRMTLGAIQACRDAGIQVPQDVVGIGTTGMRQAALFDPPLSVADQMEHQLAQSAADLLLEMIDSGKAHLTTTITPVRLIFRQSTRITAQVRQMLAKEIASGEVMIED